MDNEKRLQRVYNIRNKISKNLNLSVDEVGKYGVLEAARRKGGVIDSPQMIKLYIELEWLEGLEKN